MTENGKPLFAGSITALPTPFAGGRIDFATLHALIRRQLEGGTDAVVVGGSTGEATSLSTRERHALVEFAAGAFHGRMPVIAGVGSTDTRVACELAVRAERSGAAGLLVSTPAYGRPTHAGLERHFAAVADATQLPNALYNIPARTGVDLEPETVARVVDAHPTVCAVKEASSSLERMVELVALDSVAVLCGEDQWITDAMESGCAGVIGVVSNLVPEHVARLVHALRDGSDAASVPADAEYLAPLISALALETNPGPLKCASQEMGLMNGDLRLPLAPVSEENRARIHQVLVSAGLAA